MRLFVVCTSDVDGSPYVLSEISELTASDRAFSISGGIAGDGSVVMTRSEMDGQPNTRLALHAWDVGDETTFDRESAVLERAVEAGPARLWLVPDEDEAPERADGVERSRDLDPRVAHAQVVRLRAVETRAHCKEIREATVAERRRTIALAQR